MDTTHTNTAHCLLTIRRPDGTIEIVRHPQIASMTPTVLDLSNQAMDAAGRGKILSYENIPAPRSPREKDAPCPHCGTWCYGDCDGSLPRLRHDSMTRE